MKNAISKYDLMIYMLLLILIIIFTGSFYYHNWSKINTIESYNYCSPSYRCQGQSIELKEPLCNACFKTKEELNNFNKIKFKERK